MSETSSQPPRQGLPRRGMKRGIVFLVVVLAVATTGIIVRIHEASALHKETVSQAIPTVTILQAAYDENAEKVVLPGTVQAWHEAPIYARTNGYIKDWKVDIGAHVKEGDLLAEIETPEIDAETHQAEADLTTAEANNQLAQSTAKRWEALLKTNSVSKQETDEKVSDAAAKESLVASAKANLDHLQQLQDFKRVVAPFDGIITVRNVDNGTLINSGSNGSEQELFHIAETDKLRIYIQVPEYNVPLIKPDLTAAVYFAEHPQEEYKATLLDTAEAIDPVARTLLVQLQVNNEKGDLLPGSYAEAHLDLPSASNTFRLPVNTLVFRSEGMQVATVGPDDKVVLKSITIGRDYGKDVEVTSGVDKDDKIIINPMDSVWSGQKVKIKTPSDTDDKTSDKDKKKSDKDSETSDKDTDKSGKDTKASDKDNEKP